MEIRHFFYKTLVVVATLLGLYVLFQVRELLLLFFGAILFASTIRPAVLALKGHHVAPIISILVIYLLFLSALVGVALILFPTLLGSLQDLLKSQQTIFTALGQALERIQFFAAVGAGVHLPLPSAAELQTQLSQFQVTAQQHFASYLLDGFRVASEAVILFVLSFYWLTERDRFELVGSRMVPLRQRERFLTIFNEIESALGAFVRGQTILCGTVGVLAFVVLSLLGVRSAVALAVFAALAEAIPMIGPILGAIPALLVALLDSPEKALLVALGYLVIQQLESQILVPKIMERQLGLSPLIVLLSLTAGNLLGGIVGALVAVPIGAALRILVRELIVQPTVEANRLPVVDGGVLLAESGSEVTPPVQGEPAPVVVTPAEPASQK